MGTSASAASSLTGKHNLDGNRWNSSQCVSHFFSGFPYTLVEILMQHTLFFLVLCFAQNPIKWTICKMTKLVNRTVFSKVVDFGWKSWFCLFALIKYRWITWAEDNLLSSRKKNSMDHECSSYRWGEGPSKNYIIQSL